MVDNKKHIVFLVPGLGPHTTPQPFWACIGHGFSSEVGLGLIMSLVFPYGHVQIYTEFFILSNMDLGKGSPEGSTPE